GAKDCLTNLSKLSCRSDIYSEFFYQLSQICHNIQSLKIDFVEIISNGLADLISVQKNLKWLDITNTLPEEDLLHITHSLTNHSNTIIKLNLEDFYKPSFIAKFTNLQELVLTFECGPIGDVDKNFIFTQLRYLKYAEQENIEYEFLANFVKMCPNLKKLSVSMTISYELQLLKKIFNSCQY